MMNQTELEEGEARLDINDANIDPDTALSYIDKRLQYVLGHFRKDFEQEMSAEMLGPKYGGYGSFLPTHKHHPNKLSLPNNFHFEGAPASLNPVTLVDPVKPAALHHNDVSVDDMASKGISLLHGETLPSKNETTTSNLVQPAGQRSLKVRIKVGSYNPEVKKDEICSDPPIKSDDIPFDSLSSILCDMSSIFVPGNQLLSPLNESLLCLKNTVTIKPAPCIEKVTKTDSVDCKPRLVNDIKVKPSSDSITSEANRAAMKDVPLKIKETKKEMIKDQLFGPDFTSNGSDESYEQKKVKKLSLDSRGVRLVVCKNDPDVINRNTDRFEAKSSNNIAKLPFERKNQLTAVNRKENLRCSLSGVMTDKKSALKDIVKVRNSYKDILDTDNGAIKVENIAGNAIPAEVATPQQIVGGPAVPPDNWVGCDRCEKWRLLPIGIEPHHLPDKWLCSMSTWLPGRNHCDIGEDETTKAVQEMNLQLISQSQGILQCNDSRGNIGNSEHKNSNVPSETIANKFETSHSSMEAQHHGRQKRKGLTESNQLLLEKKGDVRPKKLKSKTDISVKTRTENNILENEVEVHAKKRKLKDVLENSENKVKMKEKRLKMELKEASDDICLSKGKTMKIKLPGSKENSVDTNHEKNKQHVYKISKKNLESERSLVVATSSSSIVSGSSNRARPVGAIVSSPISAFNPAVGKTISRKAHVRNESQSQRIGGQVDLKHKEASKFRNSHDLEHTTVANGVTDKYERFKFQRVKVKESDLLTSQPSKMRRVEVDVSSNKKVSMDDISKMRDLNEVEPKVEVQSFDRSGQNRSKVMKHSGVAANQNDKSLVTDCDNLKNLSVTSFLKEFASSQSQTALTAFKRAEESKDYTDRLKISGFDYECNNAYFDSALKFLCAASLLEACNADISKSKGVDTLDVYTTSAKLSKICAEEYEKRKEMVASTLAYKCMEVACMRIVYCKNLLTRQDLQTSMQMVTQGESPSSSASDVDNLNNQATMDKTMLSKSIAHQKNHLVVRNQANFTRLLDLTSDVNLAMEASMKAQNAYKSASTVLEEAQNKEMTFAVKRVVNFSFQDVKEFACLVQKARDAVNRQGDKRQ